MGPSSHAQAVHDAQFVAELAKPGQPRWLCLNCHAPTAVQRAERITLNTRFAEVGSTAAVRSEKNPEHEAARIGEGVGCAACHVRRDEDGLGTVVGPRGSGRAPTASARTGLRSPPSATAATPRWMTRSPTP